MHPSVNLIDTYIKPQSKKIGKVYQQGMLEAKKIIDKKSGTMV